MNTTDRYDRRQLLSLCAVLLLTPALRLFPSVSVAQAGSAAWLSPLAALPPLLAYLWFLCRFLSRRNEGEGLAELASRAVGTRAARPILLFMALWLLFYASFILRTSADRFITTIYPNSSPPIFVIAMGLLGGVAALGAARSFVRVGRLVLPLLYGVLGLVLLTALLAINPENLLPIAGRELLQASAGALPVLDVVSAVMVFYCFLVGPTPKGPGSFRAGGRWLLAIAVLLTLLAAAVLGSFGAELTAILTSPFFNLVRNLVFFRSLERVEALVVTLWVFPDFLMISVLLFVAQHCLRLCFGLAAPYQGESLTQLHGGRWLIPLCALATIVCGCLLAPTAQSLNLFSYRLIPAMNLGFVFLFLPGLYVVGRLRKSI